MSVNVIEDKVNILCEVKRVTNYERIKQMSTKEMARLLGSIFVDYYECTRTINGITIYDSFDSIGEWLESEFDDNDLIEVVRCKDCIYRGRVDCAMSYRCDCGEQHTWETDNDFCSYGERRIDNG